MYFVVPVSSRDPSGVSPLLHTVEMCKYTLDVYTHTLRKHTVLCIHIHRHQFGMLYENAFAFFPLHTYNNHHHQHDDRCIEPFMWDKKKNLQHTDITTLILFWSSICGWSYNTAAAVCLCVFESLFRIPVRFAVIKAISKEVLFSLAHFWTTAEFLQTSAPRVNHVIFGWNSYVDF